MQVSLSPDSVRTPPIHVEDVRAVLIRDHHGNPLFLAIQQDDETIWAIGPDDPKFKEFVSQYAGKAVAVKRSANAL